MFPDLWEYFGNSVYNINRTSLFGIVLKEGNIYVCDVWIMNGNVYVWVNDDLKQNAASALSGPVTDETDAPGKLSCY